ncbi:hypothetical protein HDU86_001953 [Geranomyces michiganensis]|nr:hypothetical protein HDU86_001953 [Geranomyces michiganensis]
MNLLRQSPTPKKLIRKGYLLKRPVTAPTISYRFEHQHLTHSSASGPSPLSNPSLRLPEILTAKRQVSTAIVNAQLLQSSTWEEHAQRQHEESLGSSTASSDHLATPPGEANGGAKGAGLSAWTRAALVARTGRAQTAVAERVATRNPDEDPLGFSPSSLVPKVEPLKVTAETVMGRTYLSPDQVADIPAIPSDWNVVTGQADAEVLRYERDERVRRREEARKLREESEAIKASAPVASETQAEGDLDGEEQPSATSDPSEQRPAQVVPAAQIPDTQAPTPTILPVPELATPATKPDVTASPIQSVSKTPAPASEPASAKDTQQNDGIVEPKVPEALQPSAAVKPLETASEGQEAPQPTAISPQAMKAKAPEMLQPPAAQASAEPEKELTSSLEAEPQGLSSADSIGLLVESEEGNAGMDGSEPNMQDEEDENES